MRRIVLYTVRRVPFQRRIQELNMKYRIFWLILLLMITVGIGHHFLSDESIAPGKSHSSLQTISIATPSKTPADEILPSNTSELITADAEIEKTNIKDDTLKMFQADENDNLILNESTRLNIEKLYALNTPEELDVKLQKLSTVLPPIAYRQLVNLIDYFDKYMTASKEIYSSDIVPVSIEEALDQLDGLHSLRNTHFGSEIATLFFGEEETLNRQLLEVNAQGGRWDGGNIEM